MGKEWRFAVHDETLVRELSREFRLPALVAQVLVARGTTTAASARSFLEPKLTDLHDPDLLPGIDRACELILAAVAESRPICIYGDYDVDGVTGTSILLQCLRLANAHVDFHIPDRLEEGYGLNGLAVRKLAEERPGQLLITVDCGIGSVEETRIAKEVGLSIIITDHHNIGAALPAADAIVHPRLPGSTYPFGELCGAGVAFKLAWALAKRLGGGQRATPQMREFLLEATALAAIGTIGDVVPLLDENRALVQFGLASLHRRAPLGLRELMTVAGLDATQPRKSEDIAYKLGPRINAAGRLKQARLAVELLTTTDAARARRLAEYLNDLNEQRQKIERKILRHAKELVKEEPSLNEQGAIVLADEGWHKGVIGIVAARVAEHFEKPAVMLAIDRPQSDGEAVIAQGSCRSYAGCDLYAALTECAQHLLSFGGHRQAAGLRLTADRIDAFREEFGSHVAAEINGRRAQQTIDAEVRLADVTLHAVKELDQLAPFGQKNPPPVFVASRVNLAGPPQKMGENEQHFSAHFEHFGVKLRSIAFGRGDWVDEIAEAGNSFSICFAPRINEYRGWQRVELELIDWQAET